MLSFLLSSSNAHKAEEFKTLFNSQIIKIEFSDEKLTVVENGLSYKENAFLKAKAYYEKFKCPSLADDSGLEVLSLPEELGIYSGRFGGGNLNSKEQIALLLDKMKEIDDAKRQAYFICSLCFYLSEKEYYFFEGRLDGKIGQTPRGDFGFGYDPIFLPDELLEKKLTLAEVPEWKAKNSHRFRASSLAEKFFSARP